MANNQLIIWLFLIASFTSQIIGHQNSFTYRNRRQHITQQQSSPADFSLSQLNTYTYDQPQIRIQLDQARFQQFLKRNNVTLGINSQDSEKGSWSDWQSTSTECSRKCGGGVISQTRICLDNNCEGPSKKYYSCNTEDCDPNEIDFRERQCQQFNNQPFKGRYFNWTPYLQAPNPCELNCLPINERFYYRHAEKVIDGTKCYNDGSLDICVDGQCMPVGCDKQLGSTKKEDKCGVCGGDGTTCNIVHGIYDNDNLKTGYNDLLTIPAGARNIKIEEIVPTSNYIGIRSIKGNYYLNGNWKIEFSRPIKFAGTVFNYVRKTSGQNGAESLTSIGPINEPLVLVLLYQERNRGIMYEYSTKKNESSSLSYDQVITGNEIDRMDRYRQSYPSSYPTNPYTSNSSSQAYSYPSYRQPAIAYRWWSGEWTACSKQCNGGHQQRRVICLKFSNAPASTNTNASTHELPANSEIVQDQYCDSRRKPAPIQNCNTHVCPAIWQVGLWSKCICDSRVKVRSVFCKKGTTHPDTGRPISDLWIIANDDECDEIRGVNRRPQSIKPCDDENEECVNVTVATNTTTTNQNVTLDSTSENKNETELNDKKQLELDDLLNELSTVPSLRKCEITYAYKWNVGNWTKCDSRCGNGNQQRNVTCIEIDPTTGRATDENHALTDIYCRHEKKPISQRTCNDVPCVGVDWVTSQWSKCAHETKSTDSSITTEASVDVSPTTQSEHLKNQTKLSTIQTRTVLCATAYGFIYGDEYCGIARKPETKRKCEKREEVAQWFTSEWSSCSAIECGSGYRTRSVVCAVHANSGDGEQKIKIVDDKDCIENLKPICEEQCTAEKESCDELFLVGPYTGCVDRCEETRNIICLARNQASNQTEPVDCEDKNGKFELKRKCVSDEAKDSVDSLPECNSDDLAKNCTSSEFGCCPGSDESAEGSNFKGCSAKLNEQCEKSTFGCCQHSKSESFGPFQLGCILNCSFTRYGCCSDNVTIALSEGLENCLPLCASTGFGCCLNNSTATDLEKSNCPENAKKPAAIEKPAIENEECVEEEIIEGSGSSDEIEGSGDEVVSSKPKKVCKKKSSTSCLETKFGCCDDSTTIKLDENGLGCEEHKTAINAEQNSNASCQTSKYGCCPDGVTLSTGENLQGCGCVASPFGCCLDGVTAATGPNLEGCNDCKMSKYKCCFDNKTPARGVNADGKLDCPCEATEFGCCPNRLTEAKGVDFLGCPCETLTHQCCPDGVTPAKGPKFEGCDCKTSPHGCCRDGVSVAYGPRYLGCPDGPTLDVSNSASACSLPRLRGPCRNFTAVWFFDQNYGGCGRFWYGGCEGNGNRFSSQDDCENSCMKPKGADACQLPLVKGSCTQDKEYWGYNIKKHICEQFTYGGCLGNNNRFQSREACEQTCFYSENNDPCEQPMNIGNCNGSEQRYFYNRLINKCEPFLYTTCGGNSNNFLSESECRNRCGARTAREICTLPVSTGSCLGKYPRYYFDYRSGTCKEFTFSGCEGNGNRFVDRESCEKLCNTTISTYPTYPNEPINHRTPIRIPSENEDRPASDIPGILSTLQLICNNNKDPGNCDGSLLKWHFNPIEKKCTQFYWSGCGGNLNKFDSKYDCEGRCIYQLQSYIRLQQELLLRQQQKTLEEQNERRRQQLEKQGIQKQNICLQPRETGSCYNFVQRFYYDKDDKGCHKFYYSGCNGNGNNFATFEECTQRCGTPMNINDSSGIQSATEQSFRTEDCFLPRLRGPCDNDETKWFYDSQDGVCKNFYWSGCGGNNNRFQNARECQIKCWNSQNVCLLPQLKGPCNGNFSQWYFNDATKECQEFIYGGCQGNANRFSSKETCLDSCLSQSQGRYQPNSIADHAHSKKQSDICHFKPEKGDGHEYLERYYYDAVQNTCKMFIYSGSNGNENNFERRDQCERHCADGHKLEHPEPTDLSKKNEICSKPYDRGQCNQQMARWYYDPTSFTCLSFVYSGCGGSLNSNKFYTFDSCISFCGGLRPKLDDDQGYNNLLPATTQQPNTLAPFSPIYLSPTPPPAPRLEERPPMAQNQPDDCPAENCNLNCLYGIDNYLDSRGCTRCRCSHPCHVHTCPHGQRCAVEMFRTEQGQSVIQPTCRLISKPGECPLPSVISQLNGCKTNEQLSTQRNSPCSCESSCRIDADCRSTDKCCNNGCANVCINVQTNTENREDNNSEESGKLSIKAKLNEQTVLNCGIMSAQKEVSVAWNKDNRPILQTQAALQNRVQILSNGSLLIIATRPEDNGEYTCSYAKRETSELVTKRRTLEVFDPVSILPGPRQVIATLNQPTVLECNARGIPRPTVTWWREKKMLPMNSVKYSQNPDNYQLRINSVSNLDSGIYTCQASNDYGTIKVQDITLLLEFEPNLHTPRIPEFNDNSVNSIPAIRPISQQSSRLDDTRVQDKLSQIYVRQGQITQGPNNRQFSLDGRPVPSPQEPISVRTKLANEEYKTGSSLKIDCLTDQKANITWYFNNEPIERSSYLSNLARRDSRYAVVLNADNSISIETLIRQHSGAYKCVAQAEFSYALSELTIEVEDFPLPAKCKDSPSYLNCQTIVNYKYCSNRTYFMYCCKSCVLSKQVTIEEVYQRLNS